MLSCLVMLASCDINWCVSFQIWLKSYVTSLMDPKPFSPFSSHLQQKPTPSNFVPSYQKIVRVDLQKSRHNHNRISATDALVLTVFCLKLFLGRWRGAQLTGERDKEVRKPERLFEECKSAELSMEKVVTEIKCLDGMILLLNLKEILRTIQYLSTVLVSCSTKIDNNITTILLILFLV